MKKSLQFLSIGFFAIPVSLFAQTGVNPNPEVTVTNTVIPVTATVTQKLEVQPTAVSVRAGGPPPALGLHRDTLVYTGAEQQFTIPCGATNVIITTYGASGANGSAGTSTAPAGLGGLGGQVTASMPSLGAGDVLYIYVGGAASGATGGFNGGGNGATFGNNPGPAGGGGGATDVRFPSNNVADIIQIAGGGGGGGNAGNHIFGSGYSGGAGGNGGGQAGASNYNGSNGQDCFETGAPSNLAPGAGGGTISAPGAAAPGCGGFLGSAGSGANGGNGSSLANLGSAMAVAPNGGGGGGGYQFGYGGGGASGGTSGCSGNTMGGGGGGAAGSNYVDGTASIDEIGVWSGNGMVVIEYTIVADSASISAFTTAPCVGQSVTFTATPSGGSYSIIAGPNDLSGNVFTASAETSYTLVYTATDGCGYTTNDTVSFTVACDVNSINENESAFSISPNPAQSNVTIQTNAGIREVCVMDVTGKQLMHQTNAATSLSIDISTLPAGVYFVRVTQNNGVFVKQLIKE